MTKDLSKPSAGLLADSLAAESAPGSLAGPRVDSADSSAGPLEGGRRLDAVAAGSVSAGAGAGAGGSLGAISDEGEPALYTRGSVWGHIFRGGTPGWLALLSVMSFGLADALFIAKIGVVPLAAYTFFLPVTFLPHRDLTGFRRKCLFAGLQSSWPGRKTLCQAIGDRRHSAVFFRRLGVSPIFSFSAPFFLQAFRRRGRDFGQSPGLCQFVALEHSSDGCSDNGQSCAAGPRRELLAFCDAHPSFGRQYHFRPDSDIRLVLFPRTGDCRSRVGNGYCSRRHVRDEFGAFMSKTSHRFFYLFASFGRLFEALSGPIFDWSSISRRIKSPSPSRISSFYSLSRAMTRRSSRPYGLGHRLISIMYSVHYGLSIFVTPFSGQNWGARTTGRILEMLRHVGLIAVIWTVMGSLFFWIFAESLLHQLIEDPQALAFAKDVFVSHSCGDAGVWHSGFVQCFSVWSRRGAAGVLSKIHLSVGSFCAYVVVDFSHHFGPEALDSGLVYLRFFDTRGHLRCFHGHTETFVSKHWGGELRFQRRQMTVKDL